MSRQLVKKDTTLISRANNYLAHLNTLLLEPIDQLLIPFLREDKYGYCTQDKEIKLECKYDTANLFIEQTAIVNENGSWKLIDRHAKELLSYDDHIIHEFRNGVAIIERQINIEEYFYGISDPKRGVVSDGWRGASFLIHGLIKVMDSQEMWGIIDTDGFQVAEPQYSKISSSFHCDRAVVIKDGMVGFINPTGVEMIPASYEDSGNFSEGFAAVKENGKWGLIDTSGNPTTEFLYNSIDEMSNGFCRVTISEFDDNSIVEPSEYFKYGIINKKGETVIPAIYDHIGKLFGELVWAKKETTIKLSHYSYDVIQLKWGCIDFSENVVIPFIYDGLGLYGSAHFNEGFISLEKAGRYGFVDVTGNEIVPFIYDSAGNFANGLACVEKEGKFGFIDKIGNTAIPFIYDGYGEFHDNGLAWIERDGKKGVIDVSGREIIPFIFEPQGILEMPRRFYVFRDGFLSPVIRNKMTGVVNMFGFEIVPCEFRNIKIWPEIKLAEVFPFKGKPYFINLVNGTRYKDHDVNVHPGLE